MNTDEKRDADAMRFEEVQVGDRVRTRQVFSDGTVFESEFTVEYSYCDYFGNSYSSVHKEASDRVSLSIELVSRPAPPPKVGDLLTGAQVQALPDRAVFLDVWNEPRTVLNGMSYASGFPSGVSLSYHDFTEPTYRLIYLPEEDN